MSPTRLRLSFRRFFAFAGLLPLALQESDLHAADSQPIKMVPFEKVSMQDGLWRPMIKKLVQKTLPHALKETQVGLTRLRMCAEYVENGHKGPKPATHRFNTSDLYKVVEGAALMLKSQPNAALEEQIDGIVSIIARAQQKDGYLYVSHICGNPDPRQMGTKPYSHVVHSHELYNVGHLYEAAVAYAMATGKTTLLDVAEKSAAHVNRAFFVGDPNYNDGKPIMQAPGHQEIEIGLIKLYNYTGKKLYLEMAKKFLDVRGVTFTPHGHRVNTPTYAQQHAPVNEQTEAVGHAVRAGYQYAAMAEVDSLMGQQEYSKALSAIWSDIVDKKMHISGGLGAIHGIEGFGPAYLLPNKDAYLETCAAVANVFFNMRMFLKYHDANYLDVAEVALLNNCLSGVSLEGTSFFYPNPLEADRGHRSRSGWFGCACCPSNIARLIPQVAGYMYATDKKDVWFALYGANEATIPLEGGSLQVKQITDYPYVGKIRFELATAVKAPLAIHLRIPSWARKQFVPGDLYHYAGNPTPWSLTVNGEKTTPPVKQGFVTLTQVWKAGSVIELTLPMNMNINSCHKEVKANVDRVAFTRGPLVYCAEGIDNAGDVRRFYVDPTSSKGAQVKPIQTGLLAGLPQATLPAKVMMPDGSSADRDLQLIPYFAWSNRDRSSMMTWFVTKPKMTSHVGESRESRASRKFALNYCDLSTSCTLSCTKPTP